MDGLELHGINKRMDGRPVLERLDLSIPRGEYLIVAGPSGSGKTTLLRIVAGLEIPDSGSIRWPQSPGSTASPLAGQVALVFQDGALFPQLTVRENLEFSQKIRGVSRGIRSSRAEGVASLLGIESLLDRHPEHLSGGEAQRVAIGRALMQEPSVLLLDEPLANLDPPLRLRLRGELRRLHRSLGLTVIHVTHDQEEALALGDRVALLHDGRIQQIAPPEQVYRLPANRWVAGFVGTPPMQFLEGEIRRSTGGFDFHLDTQPTRAIALPGTIAEGLPLNTRLIAGVRPEQATALDSVAAPDAEKELVGTLDRVEFAGSQTWWQLTLLGTPWMVRPGTNPIPKIGAAFKVRLKWEPLVWFHGRTGARLTNRF